MCHTTLASTANMDTWMADSIHSLDVVPGTFWERAAQTRWGRYISSAEEAVLRTAASSIRPGTALDIGCDGGRWSQLLVSLGWSLVCADVRVDAVELCQVRVPSAHCVLMKSDCNSLP